jgi:hypothetical protein
MKETRRDHSIAAVAAAASQDQDGLAARVTCQESLARPPCDGLPGELHQLQRSDTQFVTHDAIDSNHLLGRERRHGTI